MKNPEWLLKLKKFEKPDIKKSIMQMITSFVPYIVLLTTMFIIINNGVSYWYILSLSIVTTVFMIRIFIIMHDCSHFSYFRSKRVNNIVGYISGLIIFMPYLEFQHSHAIHHANSGKLDKRGVGDVWTLTVNEYLAYGKFMRFIYRGLRSPYGFLIFGPLVQFFYVTRLPSVSSKMKHNINIFVIDFVILASLAAGYYTVGLVNFILIMAPIHFIAIGIGVLLFFVQHQFENVYWSDSKNWDPVKAAMDGSSFYKLPHVLQWITGNIGFHHIHHLRPGIPNYKLNKCFNEVEELRDVKPVTLTEGFRGLAYKLWDENNEKFIKISSLKKEIKFNAGQLVNNV